MSFLAAQGGTQAAPSILFASTVKDGMLVYDSVNKALKLCDGASWIALQTTADTGTAAGSVQGAVQFRGATSKLAADDTNFVWDDTNNRLGIGTATPTSNLQVQGTTGLYGGVQIGDPASGSTTTLATHVLTLRTGSKLDFANDRFRIDNTGNGGLELSTGGNARLVIDSNGKIGIGTSSPDTSALLDVTSTTAGFLPPRMTTAQATAIASPADGLMVFDIDTETLKIHANGAWTDILATGSETDPQVDILTATKWCVAKADGSAIDCTSDAPTIRAAGSTSEIQFREISTGAFGASPSLAWDDADKLIVLEHTDWSGITSRVYNDTTGSGPAPSIIFQRGRGTPAAPTPPLVDNLLGLVAFRSYEETGGAEIRGFAGQDQTTGARAGYLTFRTTPAGTNTPLERVRIDKDGYVGIGTTTPDNLLDVTGSAGSVEVAPSGTALLLTGTATNILKSSGSLTSVESAGSLRFVVSADAEAIRISKENQYTGIGVQTPQSRLHVAGGIQLGGDTDECPGTGDAKVGTIRFSADTLELCKTSGWDVASGGLTGAAGLDKQVQFNDAGSLAGASQLVWNKVTNRLGLGATTDPTQALDVTGTVTSNSMLLKVTATAAAPISGASFWASDSTNVWRASGNVGVGTTSPAAKLDVAGGARVGADATCDDAKAGTLAWNSATLQVCVSTAVGYVTIATALGAAATAAGTVAGAVQFRGTSAVLAADDVNFVWDNTNKRLGIGTSNPQRQLELAGTMAGSSAVLRLNKSDSNAAAVIAYTEFGGSGAGWARTGWVGDGSSTEQVISLFGDAGSDLRLGANGAEVVRILSSNGNVGIGTASPASNTKLHIRDDNTATAEARAIVQATDQRLVLGARWQPGVEQYSFLNSTNDAGTGSTDFRIRTGNLDRLTVASTGNVGIGTVSPTARLNVVGENPVRIQLSAGSTLLYGGNAAGQDKFAINLDNDIPTLYDRYDGNWNPSIRLLNGNVGIGTATPTFRLHAFGGPSFAITGQPTSTNHGGVLGYTQNGMYYGILGHSNTYSFYGAGALYNSSSVAGAPAIAGYHTGANYGGRFQSAGTHALYAESTGNNGYAGYFNANSGASSVAVYGRQVWTNGHAGLFHNISWNVYCYIGHGSNYSIICSGPTSGVSDGRLKTSIKPLSDDEGLEALMAIKPVRYHWKSEGGDKKGERPELGFIAQDVEMVLPELVGETTPAKEVRKEWQPETIKSLSYERLTAPIVKAIQELKGLFDGHDSRIVELEAAGADLTRRLSTLEQTNARTTADLEARIETLTRRLEAIEEAR